MNAMKLYSSYRINMTDEEVIKLCQDILEADGDVELAVYGAKSKGWWKDPPLLDKNRYFSFTANATDCGVIKILNTGIVCEKYPPKEFVKQVFKNSFQILGEIIIIGIFEFKNKQDYVDFYLGGDHSKLEYSTMMLIH